MMSWAAAVSTVQLSSRTPWNASGTVVVSRFQQIFGPLAHLQLSIFGRTHITCSCAFCQNSNCTRTCTFVHVQFPKMHKHTFAVYKQRSVNFNKAFCFFNSSKTQTKNFCTSWLGQKLTLVSNLKTKYLSYYTHAHLWFQLSFLAVNHHNNKNWVPSILTQNLWLIFMGMKQKNIFFEKKKIQSGRLKKKWVFQHRQKLSNFRQNFMDWSLD